MKEASIGIVFKDNQSKVLLIKRRDVPIWVLPGGGIEEGELPEHCCQRELFEETGLKVQQKRCVGIYKPVNRLTSTTYVFECEALENIPPELIPQEESKEVGFFDINCLPRPTFFLHVEWIEDALKKNVAPIQRDMSHITYLACIRFALKHPVLMARYLLSRIGFAINQ